MNPLLRLDCTSGVLAFAKFGPHSPRQMLPRAAAALRRCPPSFSACRPFATAGCCDAGPPLEPTVPADPGTVKEYNQHVLVKLARPVDAVNGGAAGFWWPDHVERNPAMMQVFKTLAMQRIAGVDVGAVKVTAYDDLVASPTPTLSSKQEVDENGASQGEERCDVMIFPAGIHYRRLPVSLLDAAVSRWVVPPGPSGAAPPLPPAALTAQHDVSRKLMIFVCCHGSRDARCGIHGTALAVALKTAIKARALEKTIEVYAASHVGGHKYAGNVVIFGALHPADGDWYGGLRAGDAELFLEELVSIQVGVDGGAEAPGLRKWWRGRMGLSPEEQVALFEGRGVEALEEEEGEEEGEEDVDIEEGEAEGDTGRRSGSSATR